MRLAQSASTSFADICDTCRESLVAELSDLMQVYAAMANSHIKPPILQKVVESVADVIQVLPPERAIAPLMILVIDRRHPSRNCSCAQFYRESRGNTRKTT
ncbi:hypothetical protein RMCBS344292_10068 [Rhizopus microsporus]|nr:hypothetical protein RMCBS344292_10068 [Rhizopus microsporus]